MNVCTEGVGCSERSNMKVMSYFINVKINGRTVKCLVDTGASCSVLSSAIVEEDGVLSENTRLTEKNIKGVGNVNIPMSATINTRMCGRNGDGC